MALPSDRDLIEHVRGGDAGAFGELVRRHQARIHRLAAQMLRDRSAAEDVTQETFIRAFKALDHFDGRSEPYTWIYRIAVNLSLNTLRARKSSRLASSSTDGGGAGIESVPSAADDPAVTAASKEQHAALCEGIDALSETLRTTLIIVCIEGTSHEDASAILGAPAGTIAWRVHEARRKLSEFMSARGFKVRGGEG